MKFGIMGAMVGEIMPIVDSIKSSQEWSLKVTEYAGNIYYEAKKEKITDNINDKNASSHSEIKKLLTDIPNGTVLVLAYSKVGKVYSTLTTTILIEKFKIEKLIFTGVAGGLSKSVKIGDIVLAKNTIQHDLDITGVSKTLNYGQVAMPSPDNSWIPDEIKTQCDETLIEKCKALIPESKTYHIGTIATGDIFCDKVSKKEEILEKFKFLDSEILAIEMEGGSVNKVCQQMNVPCLIIRSISDDGDGNIPDDFGDFMYETA